MKMKLTRIGYPIKVAGLVPRRSFCPATPDWTIAYRRILLFWAYTLGWEP